MNTAILEQCHRQTFNNQTTFPKVIGELLAAGVERYYVDFIGQETIYYSIDDKTHRIAMPKIDSPVAKSFSAKQVQDAVRAIQQGKITYLEFVKQIKHAGTASYIVYLVGRKVDYIGRLGNSHIEHFPQ